MIVDDEETLHNLYHDMLKIKGHEILGDAYDGEECTKMIDQLTTLPDVIIMDHRMPKKNGLNATKELIKNHPELKIIFLSADITVEEKAYSYGATHFLKKPFNLESFFNILDQILEE